MNREEKELPCEVREELLQTLKTHFEKNMNLHKDLEWTEIKLKLKTKPVKLWSLNEMEQTGGEPDVINYCEKSDEYIFFDFSVESPKGRRSVCYDREALESRKKHKPKTCAIEMAHEMGIDLLTVDQYREMQEFGNFDTKTSSWLKTPSGIRELGGAIFGDYRYGTVFIYHNGAEP